MYGSVWTFGSFVASCTDQQKVIECLQSRLLAIKIPSLEAKSLEKIALRVINGEGLNVESDALNHIISVSQGSARSVISYLEKAELIGGTVTPEIAESLCTDISWKEFELYMTLVEEGIRWVRLSYYTKSTTRALV